MKNQPICGDIAKLLETLYGPIFTSFVSLKKQAMYHYIAIGTTLKAHMYRKRDDDQSVPDIEKYINEKLMRKLPEVNIEVDMNADVEMNVEVELNVEVEPDDEEARDVKDFFLKSLQEYGEKVAAMTDRNSIKAMKAMTKTLRKSMKCNPQTIQQQLHTFGKGVRHPGNPSGGGLSTPIHLQYRPDWLLGVDQPLGRHYKDRRGQVVKLIALLSIDVIVYT